jgi:hypothetical protein
MLLKDRGNEEGLLLVLGIFASIYVVLAGVQFIQVVASNNPVTSSGISEIAANVAPVCIGLIVAILSFQHALRKRQN